MKIVPSILAADYWRLGEQVADAERGGAERFHIDVMDGSFVPNFSLGIPIVEAMRRGTSLPLEVHLMIDRPERYTEDKSAFPGIQAMGKKSFHDYLKQIDGMLNGREWLSDRYSVLDPYGLVFYSWGIRRELPMAELSDYTAFKNRMLKRPAVGRVVENEKIKL